MNELWKTFVTQSHGLKGEVLNKYEWRKHDGII